MANYSISNNDASSEQSISVTAYKTIIQVSSQATGRAQIYDVMVGATADGGYSSTDSALDYDISRSTTTTTGTTIAATAINPADPAARALCRVNFTTEPTITATSTVLQLSLNQRASQRWVAAPGGELVLPNTSANGLSLRARTQASGYTSTLGCCIHFTDL